MVNASKQDKGYKFLYENFIFNYRSKWLQLIKTPVLSLQMPDGFGSSSIQCSCGGAGVVVIWGAFLIVLNGQLSIRFLHSRVASPSLFVNPKACITRSKKNRLAKYPSLSPAIPGKSACCNTGFCLSCPLLKTDMLSWSKCKLQANVLPRRILNDSPSSLLINLTQVLQSILREIMEAEVWLSLFLTLSSLVHYNNTSKWRRP